MIHVTSDKLTKLQKSNFHDSPFEVFIEGDSGEADYCHSERESIQLWKAITYNLTSERK